MLATRRLPGNHLVNEDRNLSIPKIVLHEDYLGMNDFREGWVRRKDTGIVTAVGYFKNLLHGEHPLLPHPSHLGFQSTKTRLLL